jgi:nucleotide-binding universal stress UspA family protein
VPAAEEIERAKLALASDLLWLISAGHVIEFNDGSLDLPRAKVKWKEKQESVEAAVSAAEEKGQRVEAGAPPAEESPATAEKFEDVVAAGAGRTGIMSADEPNKQTEDEEIGGS